ncbi:MAG: sigma-70 family RNA polymerase sigma factor, partial [Acidimicrobiia bacterium]|nr:sigma-70 family RNA polymerase sigma factor [Acidimicrobiia bacterium]
MGNPESRWPGPDPDPAERADHFAELYGAHFRPLVAFCRRRLGPGGDAEGMAQEAFLRAWASWDRYAPTRPFWPWVSTIARRLCIDQGRRTRRAQGHAAVPAEEVPPPEPDEAILALDEYEWARAALAALLPNQQRVLRLREVDRWSYDRIASYEGVTVESVRGSLKRSRQALRAAYLRLAEWNPVVVVMAAARGLARRLSNQAHRTHMAAAVSGMLSDRAVNLVAVAVAVGLGAAGGGGISARPLLPAAAATASSPSSGLTAAGVPGAGSTSGAGRGPAAARAGSARRGGRVGARSTPSPGSPTPP